jgi:hypothetical protein
LLIRLEDALIECITSIYDLKWYLALIILGPLAAWLAMDCLGALMNGEVSRAALEEE